MMTRIEYRNNNEARSGFTRVTHLGWRRAWGITTESSCDSWVDTFASGIISSWMESHSTYLLLQWSSAVSSQWMIFLFHKPIPRWDRVHPGQVTYHRANTRTTHIRLTVPGSGPRLDEGSFCVELSPCIRVCFLPQSKSMHVKLIDSWLIESKLPQGVSVCVDDCLCVAL